MKTSGPTSWPEPSRNFTTTRPAPGKLCTYAHPPTPVPCSPVPVGGSTRGSQLSPSGPILPARQALASLEVVLPRPSPHGILEECGHQGQQYGPQRFSPGEAGVTSASTTVSEVPETPCEPKLDHMSIRDTPQRWDSKALDSVVGSRDVEKLLERRGNALCAPATGLTQSSPQTGQTRPGHQT